MSLIVDASMAVKWFVEEPGSAEAERLLEREGLVAPSLILAEVANALWKRVGRRAATLEQAVVALDRIPRVLSELHAIEPLCAEAIRLAVQHDHPIYDCFYVALARREGAPLITADRKMAALAERAGLAVETIG
jgi:predicted nucleic acid-binding protein